jgi:hypothetical protein
MGTLAFRSVYTHWEGFFSGVGMEPRPAHARQVLCYAPAHTAQKSHQATSGVTTNLTFSVACDRNIKNLTWQF